MEWKGFERKDAFIMNDNRYDLNGFVPEDSEQNNVNTFAEEPKKEQRPEGVEQEPASSSPDIYSSEYNYTAPKDNSTSPQPVSQPTGYNHTAPKDDPMSYHPVYQSYNSSGEYMPRQQSPNDSNYQNYAYDYNSATDPASGANTYNTYGPTPVTKEKKKKFGGKLGLKVAAIALICALAGGATGGAATYYALSANNKSSSGSNTSAKNISIDESYNSSVEAVADKVTPSVVGIRATYTSSDNGFFGQSSESAAEGSGIVYKENGYIITNYHVISSSLTSGTIKVFLNENDTEGHVATVVGYNASSDLAVLKIDATGLTPIEIGNSDKLKVGQTAIAVGNPGGLQFMNSVSQGIISGLNRTLTMESGATLTLIQTDAAISPGNSGGALVDGTGKLIGINSAKYGGGSSDSSSSYYEGMGFAILVNEAVEICDKLIANEGNKSAYLGVTIDQRYDSSTLKQNGYPAGLVVYSVVDNSPASSAGIQANDILISLDGVPLTTYDILSSELSQRSAGDTVTIQVYRSGQTIDLTVTLGETSN